LRVAQGGRTHPVLRRTIKKLQKAGEVEGMLSAVARCLETGDRKMRLNAIKLLDFPNEKGLDILHGILRTSKYSDECIAAIEMTDRIGSERSVPYLIEAIRSESNLLVLSRIANALKKYEKSERVRRALQMIVQKMDASIVDDREKYLVEVLELLSNFGKKEEAIIISRIMNEAKEETIHIECGIALERITNHGFGYSGGTDEDINSHGLDRARMKWKGWWKQHANEEYNEWIMDGFRIAGYKTTLSNNPLDLVEISSAMFDKRTYIRSNANRIFVSMTGCKVPIDL
jgi:hypothetical protein